MVSTRVNVRSPSEHQASCLMWFCIGTPCTYVVYNHWHKETVYKVSRYKTCVVSAGFSCKNVLVFIQLTLSHLSLTPVKRQRDCNLKI